MPIWLRNFTYQRIKNYIEQQNEDLSQKRDPNQSSTKIGDKKIPQSMKKALSNTPRKPSYKTRSSKK